MVKQAQDNICRDNHDIIHTRAWQVAAAVPDPEIPYVTVEDLGILREIEVKNDHTLIVKVSPTYMGCPAVAFIEQAIESALVEAGFQAQIERVLHPAWTTEWITPKGRKKLEANGIAPPKSSNQKRALFTEVTVSCPRCKSSNTEKTSEFGSTACKALYLCLSCHEPFEYFKCL